MPETTVEDGRRSWRHRLGRSLQGVLAGLVLFVVGFPLLWWNEGRAVRTARTVGEGASEVLSVDPKTVDPQHEGRLVHVTGVASTNEVIRDPQFGVSVRALRLRRTVEMYQWREEARSEGWTVPPGGTDRPPSTTVSRVWSERLVDSSGFSDPVQRRNPPSMPVRSEERVVGRATLGAFTLSSELVLRVDRFEAVQPETLPPGAPHGLHVDRGGFFLGTNPSRPEVGDVRVRFAAVLPVTVSVVARQERGRLEPSRSRSGRQLEMVEVGVHGAAEMFAAALHRNRLSTWLLRLAGAVLLFVGLATALRPVVAEIELAPLLGPLFRLGLGWLSAVVVAALTLVTVAASIVVHGVSVTPLMRRYLRRRRTR